jgi:hypothetical protein
MTALTKHLRRQTTRLVAVALIAVAYHFTQPPELSRAEQERLAARFSFKAIPLPMAATRTSSPPRSVRPVHPSLQHIASWISAVGAGIALNDLDGDGLPNDICYVETRTDSVIVEPVPNEEPSEAQRYQSFVLLPPPPLVYEPAKMAPMGCLPGDFNEDGRMDLLVYYWGRTPVVFLRKEPSANSLTELKSEDFAAQDIAPGGERWYTNAATLADLDGDGHGDLIIGNYFQDDARILDAEADGQEQMQDSMTRAFNAGRDRLLRWTGAKAGPSPAVSFEDDRQALTEEVQRGWTLAIGAADLDGDLLPEIYFANDFGPDHLLHNLSRPGQFRFELLEGVKTLTTPNSKVLGRDGFKGMGVDIGDLNGDGYPDIFVSNIAAEFALEESHFAFISTGRTDLMRQGIAPYVDESEALGLSRSNWSWDVRLGDFDNDGVLEAVQATGFVKGEVNRWPELQELAMGNDQLLHRAGSWPRFQPGDDLSGSSRNPFFVRAADGRYYDLSAELKLNQPVISRGITTADVDGDGRLDFAEANQWGPSYFFRNESPAASTFLGLHLRLPTAGETAGTIVTDGHPSPATTSRPALGASAIVYLPDGRRLVAQVDGGNGHSGKRSPDLQFGLGASPPREPLEVELHWRDGSGRVHRQTLRLTPGWHTVLLGNA